MSFSADEIARELVAWRPRLDAKAVVWPASRTLSDLFAAHLCRLAPDQHTEDVTFAVDAFAKRRTLFVDWYAALLEPFAGALVYRDGAPRLSTGSLQRWRRLSGRIDHDALVCLDLARSSPASDGASAVADLDRWGYYLALDDPGLDRILASGLADAHVHLEASDPMPLLWCRLMAGSARVEALRLYAASALDGLAGDAAALHERRAERDLIGRAIDARLELVSAVRGRRAGGSIHVRVTSPAGPSTDSSGPGALLADERVLIFDAWRAVLGGRTGVVRPLDQYLFAKSLFLSRHVQSWGAGLGLNRFREFLDRGETLTEQRTKKRSNRVRRDRYARMLSLAAEAPQLRRLELRIAPANRLEDWTRLFRLWDRTFAPTWADSDRGLSVGFVVHLIRDRRSGPSEAVAMHFGALRQRLDRQTAVFQTFRHEHPSLARHVVGIDVANLERGCPPEVFAPYLDLLRGDARLSPGGFAGQPALAHWARLAERNRHRPPASLPRLGVTYHAGEDFHHPVDGLRAIAGLADNLLTNGDRIGHGLALGWDVGRFDSERRLGPMPQGILFDNLVWLRREARSRRLWDGAFTVAVDDAIDELCRSIYGSGQPQFALERAIDLRFRLAPASWRAGAAEQTLAWRHAFEEDVYRAREIHASPDQSRLLSGMTSLVTALQKEVLTRLRDKGISIEANPSSNLATGTVRLLSEHPFFACREHLGGKGLISFNTDDPGVFATRTDIEYALMFEAMLENGIDRLTALGMVEEARRTGMDQTFLRHVGGSGPAREHPRE